MIDPKYRSDLLRADAIRELDRIEGGKVPIVFDFQITPLHTASNGPPRIVQGNKSGTRESPSTVEEVADAAMRPHLEAALADYRKALRGIVDGESASSES